MSITIFVVATLGITAGVVIANLWNDWRALRKRVAMLEDTSDKRHLPYAVAESIEDAEAVVIRRMLKRKAEYELANADDENLLGHLKNARNNRRAR